jgi:hypothetical protein
MGVAVRRLKIRSALLDRTGRLVGPAASQILAPATPRVSVKPVVSNIAVRAWSRHGDPPSISVVDRRSLVNHREAVFGRKHLRLRERTHQRRVMRRFGDLVTPANTKVAIAAENPARNPAKI